MNYTKANVGVPETVMPQKASPNGLKPALKSDKAGYPLGHDHTVTDMSRFLLHSTFAYVSLQVLDLTLGQHI